MKILVTGANGHLGVRLLKRLAARHELIAAVRSERAKDNLLASVAEERLSVHVVDYTNAQSIAGPATGCDVIVHLVGIIKETANNSYAQAHEQASRALVDAASVAQVGKIIYVSILGSELDSANACLASRARAEQVFLNSSVSSLVVKVPMVLGEDDFASQALNRKAARHVNLELRASSLEQPIYAGDVIDALEAAAESDLAGNLELAGPECVTRRELIERAGRTRNNRPLVVSLPLAVGLLVAWSLELMVSNPPLTRAMLGVLDHDDKTDPAPACARLGIELTPLDETLKLIGIEASE